MTSSKIPKHSISPLALKIFKPRAKATFSQTQVREAMALKRLRPHVNVMQAHDCICYDDGHTAILMDRMQGSLSKVRNISIGHQKDILRQVLNGLAHIHRRGYIHRDIKPDNVLYKLDRSNRYHIKISDFGLARKVSECMTPGMMTVNYRAPEMTQSENKYTVSVDIWGAALVACELFINGPINPKINTDDILEKSTADVDDYVQSIIDQLGVCPVDFEDMLRRMLHRDPARRPSASELLESTWLKMPS
jgi:serine/threonine protein kinase